MSHLLFQYYKVSFFKFSVWPIGEKRIWRSSQANWHCIFGLFSQFVLPNGNFAPKIVLQLCSGIPGIRAQSAFRTQIAEFCWMIGATRCEIFSNSSGGNSISKIHLFIYLFSSTSYRQGTLELALTLNNTPPNPIPIAQFYGQPEENLQILNTAEIHKFTWFSSISNKFRQCPNWGKCWSIS